MIRIYWRFDKSNLKKKQKILSNFEKILSNSKKFSPLAILNFNFGIENCLLHHQDYRIEMDLKFIQHNADSQEKLKIYPTTYVEKTASLSLMPLTHHYSRF
ncbi:hypothetical protein BpHYR1_018889 [Brachionus plicatilis]|uniref:Uncharacterized protein n=1 Tax=Brachionus plicatilis TaxID=10195 RepID=A0A3M7R6A2_BRAPC|nr:hypothetical protein BpHYR1_018889 [Brachionus plicatilis]